MIAARSQFAIAEVVDGRLVVSIGVAALKQAIEAEDDFEDSGVQIVDADAFAAAIAEELNAEDEEGSTLFHLLLDRAAYKAIDNGRGGVEEIDALQSTTLERSSS